MTSKKRIRGRESMSFRRNRRRLSRDRRNLKSNRRRIKTKRKINAYAAKLFLIPTGYNVPTKINAEGQAGITLNAQE